MISRKIKEQSELKFSDFQDIFIKFSFYPTSNARFETKMLTLSSIFFLKLKHLQIYFSLDC